MSPYMKVPDYAEQDFAFSDVKQYRYYFRILDGDLDGRCKNDQGNGKANWTQISCLQALCLSSFNKVSKSLHGISSNTSISYLQAFSKNVLQLNAPAFQ